MAKQLLEISNSFTAVREEVDTLKASWSRESAWCSADSTPTNTAAIFEARSAGLFQLVPSGSGYTNIHTRVMVGAEVASDDWSL